MINSYQVTCNFKSEPKVAKKFKGISSITIQTWLRKNDNIQIHQNARMPQDLNQNPSTYSNLG